MVQIGFRSPLKSAFGLPLHLRALKILFQCGTRSHVNGEKLTHHIKKFAKECSFHQRFSYLLPETRKEKSFENSSVKTEIFLFSAPEKKLLREICTPKFRENTDLHSTFVFCTRSHFWKLKLISKIFDFILS